MRRAVALYAALGLASALHCAAPATTPLPPAPHHPEAAGCALTTLVAAIDRGDRAYLSDGLVLYSEKLGQVMPDEMDRFLAEFGTGSGTRKLALQDMGILKAAGTSPLYVITIQRRFGDKGHWSAWLVQFKADKIVSLRRADELWPFASGQNYFGSTSCGG